LVAPCCYGSALSLNPDIVKDTKMGVISKGVANTLLPAKKIHKKQAAVQKL